MFSTLVALNVKDSKEYDLYRNSMRPILYRYGGSFSYDFKISETLVANVDHAINRVFVISFPDNEAYDRFFQDPEYVNVKKKHFEASVENTHIITSFNL